MPRETELLSLSSSLSLLLFVGELSSPSPLSSSLSSSSESSFLFLSFVLVLPRLHDPEVNHVDVRPINRPHRPPPRVIPLRPRPQYPRNLHPIPGPNPVHQIIKAEQRNACRRFPRGYLVRRLLHPHELLVREDAAVVDELHGGEGVALGASGGLVDSAADYGTHAGSRLTFRVVVVPGQILTTAAYDALEVSSLEFGYARGRSEDHAPEGD